VKYLSLANSLEDTNLISALAKLTQLLVENSLDGLEVGLFQAGHIFDTIVLKERLGIGLGPLQKQGNLLLMYGV
jgi:hypothetical protein